MPDPSDHQMRTAMSRLLEGRKPSWVAAQLNVKRQTVYRWRKGQNVNAENLASVTALLTGVEPPDPPWIEMLELLRSIDRRLAATEPGEKGAGAATAS